MFSSTGIIKYDSTTGYRLTVEVDPELSNYYRSLIPRYYRILRPRYPAHITVVRTEKEIPQNLDKWGKWDKHRITFLYDPFVHSGNQYYWINIWCHKLEEIRGELGLPLISKYTMPPDGFTKTFHCTIANSKIDFT